MSDDGALSARRRRVSFGSNTQVTTAAVAGATESALPAGLRGRAADAYAGVPGSSGGSVAADELSSMLCGLQIVADADLPIFMQQQRVIPTGAAFSSDEFIKVVGALEEWRQLYTPAGSQSAEPVLSDSLQAKLQVYALPTARPAALPADLCALQRLGVSLKHLSLITYHLIIIADLLRPARQRLG